MYFFFFATKVLTNLSVYFSIVMTTSTPEKADGLKALENAIERIRETITKLGGVFTVNMAVSKQSICQYFY